MELFLKSLFIGLAILTSPFAFLFIYILLTETVLKGNLVIDKGTPFIGSKKILGVLTLLFLIAFDISICLVDTDQLLVEKLGSVTNTRPLKQYEEDINTLQDSRMFIKSMVSPKIGEKHMLYAVQAEQPDGSLREYKFGSYMSNYAIEHVGVNDAPTLTIYAEKVKYKTVPHLPKGITEKVIYNPLATSVAMLIKKSKVTEEYTNRYTINIP